MVNIGADAKLNKELTFDLSDFGGTFRFKQRVQSRGLGFLRSAYEVNLA